MPGGWSAGRIVCHEKTFFERTVCWEDDVSGGLIAGRIVCREDDVPGG